MAIAGHPHCFVFCSYHAADAEITFFEATGFNHSLWDSATEQLGLHGEQIKAVPVGCQMIQLTGSCQLHFTLCSKGFMVQYATYSLCIIAQITAVVVVVIVVVLTIGCRDMCVQSWSL